MLSREKVAEKKVRGCISGHQLVMCGKLSYYMMKVPKNVATLPRTVSLTVQQSFLVGDKRKKMLEFPQIPPYLPPCKCQPSSKWVPFQIKEAKGSKYDETKIWWSLTSHNTFGTWLWESFTIFFLPEKGVFR